MRNAKLLTFHKCANFSKEKKKSHQIYFGKYAHQIWCWRLCFFSSGSRIYRFQKSMSYSDCVAVIFAFEFNNALNIRFYGQQQSPRQKLFPNRTTNVEKSHHKCTLSVRFNRCSKFHWGKCWIWMLLRMKCHLTKYADLDSEMHPIFRMHLSIFTCLISSVWVCVCGCFACSTSLQYRTKFLIQIHFG